MKKQENPVANLLFNIVLPVLVLNQLSKRLGEDGPTYALLIALAFPLLYGAYDYIKKGEKNYISLLGIINVLLTGGLALLKLEGFWFAVKEAAFPLVIGVGVYISAYTDKPAMKLMAYNENIMNRDKVSVALLKNNTLKAFELHLRKSTKLLAISFFLSAIMNFVLARYIFTEIDPALPELEKSTLLNDQIAQMTWLGYVVIALPLTLFMGGILMHLVNGLKKLTDLELEDIFPSMKR